MGVKLNLQPYKPEWFHIDAGDYQKSYLRRIVDGENKVSAGAAELHFDDGDLYLHQTVTEPFEVVTTDSVERWVGVDLREKTLYGAAVVDDDTVKAVEISSGDEYRHHRNRLDQKRQRAMEQGKVKRLSSQRQRYTNHVCNTASREIVKLSEQHHPAGIRIEDLTGYREQVTNPDHDWPYSKLRDQIVYKATEAQIPVEIVPSYNTSTTCRKCGSKNSKINSPTEFECLDCGYNVHVAVNAAVNIATAR